MLEEEEGLLGHAEPSTKKRSTRRFALPKIRTSLSFILIALLSGLLFYLVVFTVILSKPSLRATGKKYLFGDDEEIWSSPQESDIPFDEVYTVQSTSSSSSGLPTMIPPPSATPTLASEDGLLELSAAELRAMVGRTKGYFVRDWSLALGWNNVGPHGYTICRLSANHFDRCGTSSKQRYWMQIC